MKRPAPGTLVRRKASALCREDRLNREEDRTWRVESACVCAHCLAGTHLPVSRLTLGVGLVLHLRLRGIEPAPDRPDVPRWT